MQLNRQSISDLVDQQKAFLKQYAEAILGTFAMGSCNSSMSICLKTAQEKLGVDKRVSAFSIPIGVSLHCASSCIEDAQVMLALAKSEKMLDNP